MQRKQVILQPYRFTVTEGGRGTPLVLLHGLGGSSDWFRRNFDALAESHTVHAIDLIGFGTTRRFFRRTPLPLSFEEMAALLARWIETLGGERVHLAGNSMGGQIATHLASARPDLVASLTLIDSTGIPFAIDPRPHLQSFVLPRGMLSFGIVLAHDLFRAGPGSFALALGRLLLDDTRPLLAVLRMPVLLLWGEHDPLVPLSYAREMERIVPDARLVIVPNAGHVPMWENPAAFHRAILEFLEKVDANRREPGRSAVFVWGLAGWSDGIAHRQAATARQVVLVHGLGMSSRYFEPLARELFARGAAPIAPDLRGFGESADADAMSPAEHARALAAWADALSIREAIWVGHSTGCAVVDEVRAQRPELVRDVVFIGPLWSRTRHPHLRFARRLLLDALREPAALWPFIVRAYWRAGLLRWFLTWRRQMEHGIHRPAPTDGLMIAGKRDPLVDREVTRPQLVDGAHACNFSNPAEVADRIVEVRQRP